MTNTLCNTLNSYDRQINLPYSVESCVIYIENINYVCLVRTCLLSGSHSEVTGVTRQSITWRQLIICLHRRGPVSPRPKVSHVYTRYIFIIFKDENICFERLPHQHILFFTQTEWFGCFCFDFLLFFVFVGGGG